MAEFDLEIIHKKGKLHTLPDTLSRMPQIQHISVVTSQAWMEEIRQPQEWDARTQYSSKRMWKVAGQRMECIGYMRAYYGVKRGW